MSEPNPSIMVEDSKANRYFFYSKDSSIFYDEVSNSGDNKNTILITQINDGFAVSIDKDDTIYLTCNSRYKGILLFSYSGDGWKFESVINAHNSTNMHIMDMIVQNGSIHIFVSKKLSVDIHNVYHIQKNIRENAPYSDYAWNKNSLSEIYSQNIENSYSLLPLKNGSIHYAGVWCDGTRYYINYYCYDESVKSWIHKNLSISYKNQISIKLIPHNKKINLLCFSVENGTGSIHHFWGKGGGGSEIDFKEFGNTRMDTNGTVPLFYADDKGIQAAWVRDYVFHQYTLDDSSGKWKKTLDLPLTAERRIYVLKIIKNSGLPSITKGYFLLNEKFNILKPAEFFSGSIAADKPKKAYENANESDIKFSLNQILSEIKALSENMRSMDKRINGLERNTSGNNAYDREHIVTYTEKPEIDKITEDSNIKLKKSNFKEKFMNSRTAPNFESMLKKNQNITAFTGKENKNSVSGEIPQEIKDDNRTDANKKQAFATPGKTVRQDTESTNANENETSDKNTLLKKIGEYFK